MRSVAVRDRGEVGAGRLSVPAKDHAERRSALIVAGSLLAGLVAAIALVLGPFAGGREAVITGAILLGFAVGWTLLSSNSAHRTVAGSTHQSLIADKSDAAQSSRAIGDVVSALQKKRG